MNEDSILLWWSSYGDEHHSHFNLFYLILQSIRCMYFHCIYLLYWDTVFCAVIFGNGEYCCSLSNKICSGYELTSNNLKNIVLTSNKLIIFHICLSRSSHECLITNAAKTMNGWVHASSMADYSCCRRRHQSSSWGSSAKIEVTEEEDSKL